MKFEEKVQKYALDKIALLVILALSIFVAMLLVKSRGKLKFIAEFNIPFEGVTIKMPHGGGWITASEQWIYDKNSNTLICRASSDYSTQAIAIWEFKYNLNNTDTLDERHERLKSENASLLFQGSHNINSHECTWSSYQYSDPSGHTIQHAFALVTLDNGRAAILTIQSLGSPDEILNLMNQFLDNITINNTDNYINGQQFIQTILHNGFITSPTEKKQYTLVNHTNKKGFTASSLTQDPEQTFTGRSAEFYASNKLIEATEFSLDLKNHEYKWLVKLNNTLIDISSDFETYYTIAHDTSENNSINHPVHGAVIPYFLLQYIYDDFFRSEYSSISLDIIESDGTYHPLYLEKIKDLDNNTLLKGSFADNLNTAFLLEVNEHGLIKFKLGNTSFQRVNLEILIQNFEKYRSFIEWVSDIDSLKGD